MNLIGGFLNGKKFPTKKYIFQIKRIQMEKNGKHKKNNKSKEVYIYQDTLMILNSFIEITKMQLNYLKPLNSG